MMSGPVVPDRARRQLHAVADDVVLPGEDIERVLRLQRFHLALGHGERVVGEVDLPGVLGPSRTSGSRRSSRSRSGRGRDQRPGPRRCACAPCPGQVFAAGVLLSPDREEHRVAVGQHRPISLAAPSPAGRSATNLAIGPLPLAILQHDVAEPRRAFLAAPSRSACRTSCAAGRPRPAAPGMARTVPPFSITPLKAKILTVRRRRTPRPRRK